MSRLIDTVDDVGIMKKHKILICKHKDDEYISNMWKDVLDKANPLMLKRYSDMFNRIIVRSGSRT